MWRERAAELGRPEPVDLAGACKFAALLAQSCFGGEIRANPHHTWMELADGRRIDLTDAAGVPPGLDVYTHDPMFSAHPEFRASLESCRPRVRRHIDAA